MTDPSAPFKGKTYTETALPLAAGKTGDLSLTVNSDGSITGSLSSSSTLPSPLIAYGFTASFSGASGHFTGTFSTPANSTISGTLPAAPLLVGGSFSVNLGGTSYGPFAFGGNAGGGGGGGNGFYTVDVVGLSAGASYSEPRDINDSGTVVGASDKNGFATAFIWSKALGLRDIGVTAKFSVGVGINNAGAIAGRLIPTDGDLSHPHAFISNGSGGTDIGLPSTYNAFEPVGITEGGALVGEGYTLGHETIPSAVFIYNGTFTDVSEHHESDLLGFSKATGTIYGEVYDPHQITDYWKSTGGGVGVNIPASTYSNIQFPAQVPGFHVGPNDEILAQRKDNNNAGIFGGSATDLGVTGTVMALNASGTAVLNTGSAAYIWTAAGGAKNINTLIDPALGLSVFRVWGINSSGQMICSALSNTLQTSAQGVAIVLTPPSS